MKKIALFGSTGSVGTQTIEVVGNLQGEVEIVALAAKQNVDLIERQALLLKPKMVALFEEKAATELKRRHPSWNVVSGVEGLIEMATLPDCDAVFMAMVGVDGILPTVHAIRAKKEIILANKEILVSAGEFVTKLAKENGVQIVPVDSEHSAIFQCLQGEAIEEVREIILTASGGPFLHFDEEKLKAVTPLQARTHPNWNMGMKVSIDSSTLMNKGFEVIETRWLFDVPLEKISVLVHPQSTIHSLVEFIDGSVKAQLGLPSMMLPIQYSLTHPHRRERREARLSFGSYAKLEFYSPDYNKFRCLHLAYEALRAGGTMASALNAANEVLVERFCLGEVSWLEIAGKLETVLEKHDNVKELSLEAILEADQEARIKAFAL